MAISFTKLKDPKLSLTDKLTFGKFKDCRICDIIEDHYEYLIWVEKQGFVKFQQIVIETIQEQASFKRWEIPVEDQPPKEIVYSPVFGFSDMEDDVPF